MMAVTNLALIYKMSSFEEYYKSGILIITCISSPSIHIAE